MKKFRNNNYGSLFISAGLAILLHILLFIILYLSKIEKTNSYNNKFVSLKFEKFIKPNSEEKIFEPAKKIAKAVTKSSISPAGTDKSIVIENDTSAGNFFGEADSTKYTDVIIDHVFRLDSFIVANPNLAALKTVLSQKLKNLKITETDSARIVKNFREQLLAYYKFLYPTPLSKFQEYSKEGGMISIPISDIINLFK